MAKCLECEELTRKLKEATILKDHYKEMYMVMRDAFKDIADLKRTIDEIYCFVKRSAGY